MSELLRLGRTSAAHMMGAAHHELMRGAISRAALESRTKAFASGSQSEFSNSQALASTAHDHHVEMLYHGSQTIPSGTAWGRAENFEAGRMNAGEN